MLRFVSERQAVACNENILKIRYVHLNCRFNSVFNNGLMPVFSELKEEPMCSDEERKKKNKFF